jgi:protein SCO1/2
MIRAIRYGALGMAVVLTAILAYVQFVDGGRQPAPVIDIGGPFRLASSRGGVVDSADLKGKPYAIFFGFTHCPEVCPTTLLEMSTVLEKLGPEAGDFRVFFVTVDPERDTQEAMRDYIANFDPRMEALVPTPDQLQRIARAFRIFFAKVPTSDGSYTMDHTATVFLMDGEGHLASTIAFGENREAREAKLRKLLGL